MFVWSRKRRSLTFRYPARCTRLRRFRPVSRVLFPNLFPNEPGYGALSSKVIPGASSHGGGGDTTLEVSDVAGQ